MPIVRTWEGKSKGEGASFARAAELAANKAKEDLGRRSVQLRVVDMYVKVSNPIHEYIVVLGTGG